ncbi:MAG: octanoyltransferase [Thalassobium sp.]|jgi:lipoyl(octanoyl) transferase|uniref:Octanoyltransferase n=1 Tax=Thalassolituus pacificus TaxID=2975440 RepID=A0A9X2WI15_9GAMM|nr:lipoyl(octanoyl) transferase LipB [Thalassolituus pacificus]MCT7360536.1 lipoyl(octanoyl) transferase LipB [Thalassolituus pacificus]PHS66140.1 MAG: octanoyltransferase [Thalassobium sp.]
MTEVLLRELGLQEYTQVYDDMLAFTAARDEQTADELWFLQHDRVFTQGQAGKAEHVLMPGDIPVVQSDRGGQVTYHGPGQLVVYLMVDIKRLGWGPRALVSAIERAIVATLNEWQIDSAPREDAPGVYVGERKIASLGLRIKNGRSFHGLALNIDMDLEPFQRINPCGYAGMQMTQMRNETDQPLSIDAVIASLQQQLLAELRAGGEAPGA